ncbi:hypothetical protein CCS79_17300 [Clostridium diolis]|uniref:radical SAM protein n=1 Tax=Clostridium diolis TaxID=223919 RepID=UPI000B404E20|nr:radical SAM protein [Clostridium diolis]OVE66735.1 hypothetical protein CCS79_17300 [Clostridium diolis]
MSYKVIDNSKVLSAPLVLSFEITNKCMLKCLHCYNRSGDDLCRDELSNNEILEITRDIAKTKLFSFCFCGGETLLRYDLILKMCDILVGSCPNINMVSNGYLMDEEKVSNLKKHGMKHIQISIDGPDSETHDRMRGVEGSFERAINAVKIINESGLDLSVAFCPTNFNIDKFPNLIESLKQYKNLIKVRVQPLMLMGRGYVNNIAPSEEQYRKLVDFINTFNDKNSASFSIEWGDPVDHLIRFKNFKLDNNLFTEIKSDGMLTVSSYIPVYVGNLKRHTYSEYWKSGIGQAWKLPIIQEVAEKFSSISDLGSSNSELPRIFFEKSICIDFVDDKPLDNIEKFNLKNLI